MKIGKLFASIIGVVLLTGCVALPSGHTLERASITYAVFKIKESNQTTGTDIRRLTAHARELSGKDAVLSVDVLVEAVANQINWGRLDVEERILITLLLDEIKFQLRGELDTIRLHNLLDWIDNASYMRI